MMKKFSLLLSFFVLSACAGSTSVSPTISALDVPAFEDTKVVQLPASKIVVMNEYAQNKYTGDYADYFVAKPYEVFEDYLRARFKPSGSGDVLTLKINKASLIHVRESLGGSNDDDVFALDFDVDVVSASGTRNVKAVNTMRQRRDVTIADSVRRKQLDYLSRSIAAFDEKIISGF